MTNEKIEKRFLFDLEMGVFKRDKDNENFVCLKFLGSNYHSKNIKFIVLLNSIGYNDKYNTKELDKFIKFAEMISDSVYDLYFYISPEYKDYFLDYKLSYNYTGPNSDINLIPEYVKEYIV